MDPIELMTAEEVVERIDRPLLLKQLQRVLTHSPFYRDKFGQSRSRSSAGFTLNDFFELPFTTREELLLEQRNHPPYGRLSLEDTSSRPRRVHMTSGSTAAPYYIVLTEKDAAATVEAGRRAFTCAGVTSSDTVIHCLNYCLWAGGVTDHLSLEACGAAVIPFGVGNSRKLIDTIMNLRPTAISCTPSYLSRLEVLLEEDLHAAPTSLGLKKAFLGGEGGLQDPKIRAALEDRWGIQAIDANYGMADVLSLFGAECRERQGLHFHGQGILHLELIDPGSGKTLDLSDGRSGELVLTNLTREAQPLVRYKTRDVIRVVSVGPCACGRRSLRFVPIGRTDDMLVVRGVNVYPEAIASILAEAPDWFSREFEIVLETPAPHDRILLRVELSPGLHLSDGPWKEYLASKLKVLLNISPGIEYVVFGELPRTEGKSRRIRNARSDRA